MSEEEKQRYIELHNAFCELLNDYRASFGSHAYPTFCDVDDLYVWSKGRIAGDRGEARCEMERHSRLQKAFYKLLEDFVRDNDNRPEVDWLPELLVRDNKLQVHWQPPDERTIGEFMSWTNRRLRALERLASNEAPANPGADRGAPERDTE